MKKRRKIIEDFVESGFAVENQVFKAEAEDAGGIQPADVVAVPFDEGGSGNFWGFDAFNRRVDARFHRRERLIIRMEHMSLVHIFGIEDLGDDPIARVAGNEQGRKLPRPGDGGEPGFFGVQIPVADVTGTHGTKFSKDEGVGKFGVVLGAVDGGKTGIDKRAEFGQSFENLNQQVRTGLGHGVAEDSGHGAEVVCPPLPSGLRAAEVVAEGFEEVFGMVEHF